jgi:hypothetical protein
MQVKYEPWGFEKEEQTVWGVRILEGKFANTVISFNDINLKEEDDSNLQLDYTVVHHPENMMEKYMSEDPDFQKDMGWILEDILRKAINEHENRESNSTKSDK